MTEFAKVAPSNLLQRTRDLATMTKDELRKFASEAARDRDAAVLYALTEAHLTLHGSSGKQPHAFGLPSRFMDAAGRLVE